MPIYEYRCRNCGHIFEEWTQHFASPASEPCPKCGQPADHIISNTSFMLKGSGWYVTEYGTHKGKTEGGPAAAPDAHHDGNPSKNADAAASKPSEPAAPAPAQPAAKTDA